MYVPNPNAGLLTPLRLWLFALGLVVVFGLLWLRNSVVSPTPQLATIRAVQIATSGNAGEVRVAGRYPFRGVEGLSRNPVQLVCGSIGPDHIAFAALVQRHGRRSLSGTYTVDELVIDASPGESIQAQETKLLSACAERS